MREMQGTRGAARVTIRLARAPKAVLFLLQAAG